MNTQHYLDLFQKAADRLDKEHLDQAEIKVGVWLNSVALKIQKSAWVNQTPNAKSFQEGIFFSVWINDDTISRGKLYYNIHALKVRELQGYKIQSRSFAEAFRSKFKPFEKQWPNVSVDFGPLTLMEGWIKLNTSTLEKTITELARKFFAVAPIIDHLLKETKK